MHAYNETLERAMSPGKYLCIDESMNQWLGHGMPNLKKVPRKPHPVGQEYKTLADTTTSAILRLDFTGDKGPREYEPEHPAIVAPVMRLCKPYMHSGRTIIADSWFGSPIMVRTMKEYGLYSIMQAKRRRYWPRGMPQDDVGEMLGGEFGSTVSLKTTSGDMYVSALQDRKPKVIIANCSTTTSSDTEISKFINGEMKTMHRPQVFDEYETNKGKHDTRNVAFSANVITFLKELLTLQTIGATT